MSRTKTIAGYNLEPTPWHPFPVADHVHANAPSTYGRILRCSYLSCTANLFSASRLAGRGSDPPRPSTPPERCPFVFRWIREDLAPWAETGISAEDVAAAKERAAMRVVVVGGRLYVDLYYACVQSRAVFTVWGVLQLLRRYPGEVPDVDLMFDCMDRPVVERSEVQRRPPPPLFRYSTSPRHYDIPFPDWSFWGWYVCVRFHASLISNASYVVMHVSMYNQPYMNSIITLYVIHSELVMKLKDLS